MNDIYLITESQRKVHCTEIQARQVLADGDFPHLVSVWHGGVQHWLRVGKLVVVPRRTKSETGEKKKDSPSLAYSI